MQSDSLLEAQTLNNQEVLGPAILGACGICLSAKEYLH